MNQFTLFVVIFLLLGLLTAVYNSRTIRRFDQYPPAASLPRVSILVPARNEERNIESCGQCHSRGVSKPSGSFGYPWNDKENKPYALGEPLDNYDNVLKAIAIINSDHGIALSARKITLSTCGLAPAIERLGKDSAVNLAVSLNAPDDRRRNELMPINRKYPIQTIVKACQSYPMPKRRRITFEYILIAGVNDSPADAKLLVRAFGNLRCKFNLILFNEFPGSPFKAPTAKAILDRHQRFVLTTHVRPDCDALGSELAMAGLLEPVDAALTAWSRAHNPFFAGPSSDLLALLPFALLTLLLLLVGREKLLASPRSG